MNFYYFGVKFIIGNWILKVIIQIRREIKLNHYILNGFTTFNRTTNSSLANFPCTTVLKETKQFKLRSIYTLHLRQETYGTSEFTNMKKRGNWSLTPRTLFVSNTVFKWVIFRIFLPLTFLIWQTKIIILYNNSSYIFTKQKKKRKRRIRRIKTNR